MKHLHFIAICGTGMASLACLMKGMGYTITGSDRDAYPPMSTLLEKEDIEIVKGFNPSNLNSTPDLVIIGNVVTRDNPEAMEVMRRKIPYLSFPEALKEFFLKDRIPIVVAGTHGKTTTSSLLAWILESSGFAPSFLIGGVPLNFDKSFKLGKGRYIVVEGDEYDCAFFDKRPKFIHYMPFYGILTNIEFDHADIYRDLDHVKEAFKDFVKLFSPEGLLLAGSDNPHVGDVLNRSGSRTASTVQTFGFGKEAHWRAEELHMGEAGLEFSLIREGKFLSRLSCPLYGEHNCLNVLGATTCLLGIGIPLEKIKVSLKTFLGVKRRMEIIGKINGITIIDDFAHHPTEVRETIRAVKQRFPQRRVWAVFEPRTATSRRNVFQEIYPRSLAEAYGVIIGQMYEKYKIPSEFSLNPELLVKDIENLGKNAWYLENPEEIIQVLLKEIRQGDVILIMSSGSFGGIHRKICASIHN